MYRTHGARVSQAEEAQQLSHEYHGDGHQYKSILEKQKYDQLLARTVHEDSLPRAQHLILGKLIE